jgi:Ca-activated chloride channel family protein
MDWRNLALLAFLLAAFPLQGQVPSGPGSSPSTSISGERFTISKDVNQVNLLFTIDGRKEAGGGQLAPSDISLSDDNKPPAAVLKFRTEQDLPLRVGLLIDTSDSVRPAFRFEQASATAFIRELIHHGGDMGFIMGFAHAPKLAQSLTGDQALLARGVAKLSPGGDTAFLDAVIAGCRELNAADDGSAVARILIVLSDGEDNTSRNKVRDALAAAEQTETTIFVVRTEYTSAGSVQNETKVEASRVLHRLAEDSGGRFFSAGSVHRLAKAFGQIQNELRMRYSVLYVPADFRPDGRFRRIKVTARKAGQKLRIRARKGYYARSLPPAAEMSLSRP